jgi:hypothetical protein
MNVIDTLKAFGRKYWIGTVVILIATCIFFGPMLIRAGSYSDGGDAMFNAWTLARNYHCILHQDCPTYANGNIFFPDKNSMLYSETQLSTAVVTLPLYFINNNPVFANNVWTIASFFLMGWSMYLLAMYLSKNKQFISILAGLIFEFAPFRMAAVDHLQNISIYCLPLAFLMIFKYLDTKKRGYLIGLFAVAVMQFYASWYQMVFVLAALGILIAGLWLFKVEKAWKTLLIIAGIVALAALSTYPLAKEYVNFSKTSSASFSIGDQATYSSSLLDFFTPNNGTLIGKIFYAIRPASHLNSYDTDSYSYYGFTLYFITIFVLAMAYRYRKKGIEAIKKYKMVVIFALIALAGVLISFGPLLKIRGAYLYHSNTSGLTFAIPLPYFAVDKLLPQLAFLRALGRAGVLILFSLCCLFAYAPFYAKKVKYYITYRTAINCIVVGLIIFELAPFHFTPLRSTSYSYGISIPPVYTYIKDHKNVNNIIVLAADSDYPNAGIPIELPEETMWAGYDNKNTFNGYSGYLPPTYYPTYWNFLDFRPAVVPDLKKENLHYVLVDKLLSTTNPNLVNQVANVLGKNNIVYQDKRYDLFKVTY